MRNKLHNYLIAVCMVLVCAMPQAIQAQCTFYCNDTINVSVDFNCMAEITFDMILEGADSIIGCEYAIDLTNADGSNFNGATVGPPQVGSIMKVKVFENNRPNGPSCWGYIKIEDKLPPPLVCAGNDTLMCQLMDPYFTDAMAETTLEGRIQPIINMTDNCGNEDIEVIVTDNMLDRTYCMDGYSAIRYLSYNILDNSRNVLQCRDTILYEQLPLDTIEAPKNYTDNMSLDCNDPYPTVGYLISIDRESRGQNSLPNFQGRNLFDYIDSSFVERGLCNLKTTYQDLIFPNCGATFKIIRRWTILDWCNGSQRDFNQIIKVQDTDVRIISGCNDSRDNVANPQTCAATVELTPPAVATNECSDWTFIVEIKDPGTTEFTLFGRARPMTVTPIRRDFPLGISEVKYTVTDACGNIDSCTFEVEVVDEDPPIPVCDAFTVVTLNSSFLGKVFAKSFDDGSFDACTGIASYQVRRVDRGETTCETPTDFADFVKFCCADIGKSILVEMQVTDSTGLTASCIAEAVVQFKGPGPQITCAAPIGIQDCRSYDSFDIMTLTAPSVASSNPCIANNLTPSLREVDRALDDCGVGYIDVEWFVNITGTEEIVCAQRITFANQNPFVGSLINWPADRDVTVCGDVPPLQSELDNLVPDTLQCSNILPSEPVDRVFDDVSGACKRILRTWTVVDWCRFPADLNARYTYVQTITVLNTSGPTIDAVASAVSIVEDQDNCRAVVSASGVAMDDCAAIMDIRWTHEIRTGDGFTQVVVPSTAGRSFSLALAIGSYEVRWTATDDCGNTSMASETFSVSDTQAPRMRCSSIQRRIDADTKDAIITLNDLDDGSFDNCDASISLSMRRAGTTDTLSQILIFECGEQGITQVEIVGTDAAGNTASCIAAVDIRDFEDECNLQSSAVEVSGFIYTAKGVAVEDVAVNLSALNGIEEEMIDDTDVEGAYIFENVSSDMTYAMSANKIDDYRNGISTLDIILMQQHILGLRRLESPYQQIAADVNGNQSVSATDIVLVRRLLLGAIDFFPGQPSWKFVDKSAMTDDTTNPWSLPTSVELSAATSDEGLIGIKMGDLDNNAVANSALASGRSVKSYAMLVSQREVGREILIDFEPSEDFKALGLQLGIDFDPSNMLFKGVTAGAIEIPADNVVLSDGHLRVIWTTDQAAMVKEGESVFTLRFDKVSDNSQHDIKTSSTFSSEIYGDDLDMRRVHIVKEAGEQPLITLYQNRPNPFSDNTIITFELPERQHIDFTIYDVNGARVFGVSENFIKGLNQLNISKDGLGLNKGIYYYEIKSQERSLIKKMILL